MLIRLKYYLLQTDFVFPFKQNCAMKLQPSVLLCKVNPLRNFIYPPILFENTTDVIVSDTYPSSTLCWLGLMFSEHFFYKNISKFRFSG